VQAEKKVNLGIGAYRDEAGKPWVLECVKAVSHLFCVSSPVSKGHCLQREGGASGSDCELQEGGAAAGIDPALVGFPFATHRPRLNVSIACAGREEAA